MKKRESKEQRTARLERLREQSAERMRVMFLNHLYDHREAVQQYSPDQKKATVIEFIRYGCSTVDIQKASGFSLAFVNDVIREFAHNCLVSEVKANGEV